HHHDNIMEFAYEPVNEDIRVVVGVDFGTTYSGFAYAYVHGNKEIVVNDEWGNFKSNKTNTALQYDETYSAVLNWGVGALSSKPTRRKRSELPKPIEYFKFYLSDDVPEEKKPELPPEVPFEKAITDFLREMAEAASIYCINKLKEFDIKVGETYLVVDCGGGTVDLTVIRLLADGLTAETTERTGHFFCGSTYVDDEFLKFLEVKAGKSAVKMLKEKHYDQVNYMVHKFFCPKIKIPFSGEKDDFQIIEFDIKKDCPALIYYMNGPERVQLEEDDWLIDLDFATVKSFFDPAINNIIILIAHQLSKCPNCSVLFLVGGFGESVYLQRRIKEAFGDKIKISIPPNPATAILRGACEYGLDMGIIASRVLNGLMELWFIMFGTDPVYRMESDGRIKKFHLLASKGTKVDVEKEISYTMIPTHADQTSVSCQLFYTSKYNATYCDEPHVKKLCEFIVDGLPTASSGKDRSVLISLRFASMGNIVATAKSLHNGEVYHTTFSME
ncbi:3659_t:CDS:2, partial [Gigaspora rosea]